MWMVRNDGGNYADEFKRQNIVAIGWQDAGSMKGLATREQIIHQVRAIWPDYRPMKAVVTASQLDKIANVINAIKVNDRVITYDPSKRVYYVGRVSGDYEFDSEADDCLANRRKVVWLNEIERDRLSVPTKNSLGSALTVFEVPEAAEKEIDSLIAGNRDTAAQPEKFATSEADLNVQTFWRILSRRRESSSKTESSISTGMTCSS